MTAETTTRHQMSAMLRRPKTTAGGHSSEYRNLRHVVPSLRRQRDVDKVEVVTEAARYIDHLHKTLIERFVVCGIPNSLKDVLSTDDASELGAQHIMKLVTSMAAAQRQEERRQQVARERRAQRPAGLAAKGRSIGAADLEATRGGAGAVRAQLSQTQSTTASNSSNNNNSAYLNHLSHRRRCNQLARRRPQRPQLQPRRRRRALVGIAQISARAPHKTRCARRTKLGKKVA